MPLPAAAGVERKAGASKGTSALYIMGLHAVSKCVPRS
jgi:hypothetical protein